MSVVQLKYLEVDSQIIRKGVGDAGRSTSISWSLYKTKTDMSEAIIIKLIGLNLFAP